MLFSVLAFFLLGGLFALSAQVRGLARRLEALERRDPLSFGGEQGGVLPALSPLAGLRVALSIAQDHPHPVFEGLLREAFLRKEAVVDDASALRIEGEIVGNGYADVYFRAEIIAKIGDETILSLTDKPPHGDRPANLAAEVIQRLGEEIEKRERRGALRELRG